MAAKTNLKRKTGRVAAGSWLALLAMTTLGDGAGTLRAEVKATAARSGPLRLVVQSYEGAGRTLPGPDSRPVASVQREVTAAELRRGVQVDLVGMLSHSADSLTAKPTVVAWIEAGHPDLEFDGLKARPQPGSMYGVVRQAADGADVSIQLDRVLV
jgi:hypothetical protein